ncbi:MAG: hypothetical protein COW16_02010 [Sphingomonadales bacterium CG12_big_fil_rev_8_21_14_0_65_65_10]|mgnify:CR=1 FL=1|jgi:hypothetical protein|uniref:Uncharacterized protein n=1 Tax=Blastomonas marina TaxID=1867408 RepID=A0ABQ1FB54_9SPHN|nr:hypothetical protein [Blastomonas marina]PIW56218.1 MAG: hypothetical protein COW16_02010 [Sphingomonadales bacterium CG12_big_fil_rev_8_21_14_0_65_65_10]WPZ05028.1 hypothetical protein T8S45_05685 [Blastomonas marina]GGA05543.1 hypothetical protein GCM10010923_14180 [Blastomonas marina]
MRRALVLTDEGARHPFRMSLPRHVTRIPVPPQTTATRPWITRQDARTFVHFYVACFVATLLYIS